MSRTPGYLSAGVVDAYAALRMLAREPKIDASRIAIIGFSYGADVAHLAAFELFRSALDSGQGRFAAHVAFYPAGNVGATPEAGVYTGSPVLMLFGEKDDNLPIAKIENYLAYARAAGHPAPIETVIYPGAYHAWTVPSDDAALLPRIRQYEKMPAHSARVEGAGVPHRGSGQAVRSEYPGDMHGGSAGLFDAVRRGGSRAIARRCDQVSAAKSPTVGSRASRDPLARNDDLVRSYRCGSRSKLGMPSGMWWKGCLSTV
jgi:acetyl esterase/lipase